MDSLLNPWQTSSLGDMVPYQSVPGPPFREQGYDPAWFTSSVSTFEVERLPELMENLGFEEFYPDETMNIKGFEKANYLATKTMSCWSRARSGWRSRKSRVSPS
jgi:hypothetical protein